MVMPGVTPVANPVLETVATPVGDKVHVADEVRFCVLPSV